MSIYLHTLTTEELESRAREYAQKVTMIGSPLCELILALCDRIKYPDLPAKSRAVRIMKSKDEKP
jgi:hypothetical protein